MLHHLLEPEIRELVREKNVGELRESLIDWDPTEIAGLIETLPFEDGIVVFRLLPRSMATRIFEQLPPGIQRDLVDTMAKDKEYLTRLLNDLSPDDRTAFLEELPGRVAQRLLTLLSPEEYHIAVMLLGYPEESIGRLMTPEYVAVRPGWTIQQALDHIRVRGKDSETLNVIYVVDQD